MGKPHHSRKTLLHIEKNAKGELFDICNVHTFLLPRAEHSSCTAFNPNTLIL